MNKLVVLSAFAALVLAGCGGDDPTLDDGTPPGSTETESSDSDAAGGTTMRVYTVDEVVDAEVMNPVHVSGLLIDSGSGWQLCANVLESYPPQCGEPSLTVDGVDETEFELEEANGVRWHEGATLVGNVEGGTLTVTGSATSS